MTEVYFPSEWIQSVSKESNFLIKNGLLQAMAFLSLIKDIIYQAIL
jgi:hypothetical protein